MRKALLLIPLVLLLGALPYQATTPTAAPAPIPAEAKAMTNPFHPSAESMAHAKKMYGYDCVLCHGADGKGKGDAAVSMNLKLRDWTDPAALQGMTDGELYYIIANGQGQMPAEGGERAKPEDLWNMVLIVRGFAKK